MAATSDNYLTALPPELLGNILELLPACEIGSLRKISRGFRDYIDKYEDALASLTIAHHRQRIHARIAWLLDLDGLDLIHVAHRYTSYYGPIKVAPGEHGRLILSNMVAVAYGEKVGVDDLDSIETYGRKVLEFWQYFTQCHAWIHRHSPPPDDEDLYAYVKDAWIRLEAAAKRLDDPAEDPEYLRAKTQLSSLLRGPHYTTKHGIPKYPITAR